MKMSDLSDLNEDGRIVKGVNTTPDVSTDEIKTQAAKFGFNVDKDGRPPTLSKKVKGKSTNVLFNLGLAEGYKLQLERDKQMLVLNIKNTTTGQRTEVRGKPGYETGNYDPDDDLHQLLDTIGKSVDISQLMNGEPVGINPKHPDSAKAKAATDKAYSEERYTAMEWACIEGGHCLEDIQPKKRSDLFAQLENFADGKKKGVIKATKEDILAYKKIIGLAKKAYETNEIDPYFYDAVKITFNLNLYKKYPKLLSTILKIGRNLAKEDWPEAVQDIKKNTGIDLEAHISENFADGKKKGKSRPGRVKKSGASCNGSVTALRKRAKNSSGEKAKMYHWCANMKSGRKKK